MLLANLTSSPDQYDDVQQGASDAVLATLHT
jgi:hypothetical protein